METDEGLYHATPQTRGRVSHESVDTKKASNKRDTLMALPIYSSKFGLVGKIDIYKQSEKLLVERKYQLKQLFRGQIYQLWAQYFCLIEMGYLVEKLAFYEISSNKTIPIAIPTQQEEVEFTQFIERFKNFDPSGNIEINLNKCRHCIYCNLCDKTEQENVYQ
jgi:CRISPR-associated protein Cas4